MADYIDLENWRLPGATISVLLEIPGIDSLVEKLRQVCMMVLILEGPEHLSAVRAQIESFGIGLRQLAESIEGISSTASSYLHADSRTGENFDRMGTGRLRYLGTCRNGLGKELSNFWNEVVLIEKHVSSVLESLDPSRAGAPPKQKERMLALCIAQVLLRADIPISRYADGVYFQVLEQIFPVVFPGSGPDAHRDWAHSLPTDPAHSTACRSDQPRCGAKR